MSKPHIPNEKYDVSDYVFAPPEIARIGTAYIHHRRQNAWDAMPLGIPAVDTKLNPLLRGDFAVVLGRPGNGKTGLMMWWARTRSNYLLREKPVIGGKPSVVVYVTYEQHAEDLHLFSVSADRGISATAMRRGEITDDEYALVVQAGAGRALQPLWFVGHSKERRGRRPRLSVDILTETLWYMENKSGLHLDSVFVDYLQRLPYRGDKVEGIGQNLSDLKDMTLELDTRLILGVQAKREVDGRDVPTPKLDDGAWAADIEQIGDIVISTTRPRVYCQPGETFGKDNPITVEGHDQMLLYLLKQKQGPANLPFWVKFDPIYNQLDAAELRAVRTDRGHPDHWTDSPSPYQQKSGQF